MNSVAPDGSTPLLQAVRSGDRELVEILTKAGADTNHAGANGETSLHLAARRGVAEIAFLLVDAGGDVNRGNAQGVQPIVLALEEGHEDVARVYAGTGDGPLFSPRELRSRDAIGRTPLLNAAMLGLHRYLKRLIADGSELEARDNENCTALILAAANNQSESVQILLDAGADLEATDKEGSTALTHAAWRGHLKLLKMFIARGAKVDTTRGPEKLTPLMGAASTGNLEVVRALLDAGADPNAKSASGKMARDFAEAASYRRIAKLLAEAESQPARRPQRGPGAARARP